MLININDDLINKLKQKADDKACPVNFGWAFLFLRYSQKKNVLFLKKLKTTLNFQKIKNSNKVNYQDKLY
jgi:hypothetical protein